MDANQPGTSQRRKALVTGIVLGTMALAVYLVLIFRVFTRG